MIVLIIMAVLVASFTVRTLLTVKARNKEQYIFSSVTFVLSTTIGAIALESIGFGVAITLLTYTIAFVWYTELKPRRFDNEKS